MTKAVTAYIKFGEIALNNLGHKRIKESSKVIKTLFISKEG